MSRLSWFGLGIVTGVAGTLLYERLKEIGFPESVFKLADKLSESVAELDSRVGAILEESGGKAETA
jgi:hypothetical protein